MRDWAIELGATNQLADALAQGPDDGLARVEHMRDAVAQRPGR
jgi:hypothetical protein